MPYFEESAESEAWIMDRPPSSTPLITQKRLLLPPPSFI